MLLSTNSSLKITAKLARHSFRAAPILTHLRAGYVTHSPASAQTTQVPHNPHPHPHHPHDPYRVLVLGGYGTFGGYVADALALDPNIALTIAGRNHSQAQVRADAITQKGSAHKVACVAVDALNSEKLRAVLRERKPHLVVHTCGPFQGQGLVFYYFYGIYLFIWLDMKWQKNV